MRNTPQEIRWIDGMNEGSEEIVFRIPLLIAAMILSGPTRILEKDREPYLLNTNKESRNSSCEVTVGDPWAA
jgi:hypothetical protein